MTISPEPNEVINQETKAKERKNALFQPATLHTQFNGPLCFRVHFCQLFLTRKTLVQIVNHFALDSPLAIGWPLQQSHQPIIKSTRTRTAPRFWIKRSCQADNEAIFITTLSCSLQGEKSHNKTNKQTKTEPLRHSPRKQSWRPYQWQQCKLINRMNSKNGPFSRRVAASPTLSPTSASGALVISFNNLFVFFFDGPFRIRLICLIYTSHPKRTN